MSTAGILSRSALFFTAVFFSVESAVAAPLTRSVSHGGVEMVITFDNGEVSPGADIEMIFDISSAAPFSASLSEDIDRKLEGFSVAGVYTETPAANESSRREIRHYRLIPIPGAERYRLKPFAVTVMDSSVSPPAESWFPTPSVVLRKAPVPPVPSGVVEKLSPISIAPSVRSVAIVILYILLAAAVVAALAGLAMYIRFRRRLAAMSPRERAFWELERLLSKKLFEKGLVKKFYLELTMLVRRYVERTYGIRAPERTTEEFLKEAAEHEIFDKTHLPALEAFLLAADLVKFANVRVDSDTVSAAIGAARNYIEQDSRQAVPAKKGK